MAEYIGKESVRDEIAKIYKEAQSDSIKSVCLRLYNFIKNLPPADVRPVVLCDECRWFSDRGYTNPDPEIPELRMGHCRVLGRDVQACWFCATGEREGGDAE